MEGGESDIVSTHDVFNVMQRDNAEVVETLATPNWYFDRKGEVSAGEDPWYVSSIIYMENEPDGTPRVYSKIGRLRLLHVSRDYAHYTVDPNNVTSLKRFSTGPDARIPSLSDKQAHAIKVLDETCSRLALHMILDPGDIQLLHNPHVYHARTAFKDFPAGSVDASGRLRVRRHLMRLWLAVPESEGGWKLPYHDANEKKRGGIQVDYTPPVCPLDAE